MNGSRTRWAVVLAGLAAMTFVACGGSSFDSPVTPVLTGVDAGDVTALGYGPGAGAADTLSGDGICDGVGDGTCDGSCDATGSGSYLGRGPGNGNGPGDGTCDGTVAGPDPDDLQTLLVEALQEEHKAEQTYRRVLAGFGSVAPFAAIADSEQMHVQALLRLFARREWTAPPSAWTLGNVVAFDTLTAACAGGVAVEIEDGALYDGYLSRNDLPRDVVNVFTNLRAASLEHHLPAFQACQ